MEDQTSPSNAATTITQRQPVKLYRSVSAPSRFQNQTRPLIFLYSSRIENRDIHFCSPLWQHDGRYFTRLKGPDCKISKIALMRDAFCASGEEYHTHVWAQHNYAEPNSTDTSIAGDLVKSVVKHHPV